MRSLRPPGFEWGQQEEMVALQTPGMVTLVTGATAWEGTGLGAEN